jgi:hypothetical protein
MLQNCEVPIQCTRESFRMFLAYPHTRPRLMARVITHAMFTSSLCYASHHHDEMHHVIMVLCIVSCIYGTRGDHSRARGLVTRRCSSLAPLHPHPLFPAQVRAHTTQTRSPPLPIHPTDGAPCCGGIGPGIRGRRGPYRTPNPHPAHRLSIGTGTLPRCQMCTCSLDGEQEVASSRWVQCCAM